MNFGRRRKYESWLVPYAEGTLDARRRTELEAAFRRDPALAADAEAQQRIGERLRGAALAEETDTEAAPGRLWPQIHARISPKRRVVAPWLWAGGACAAACLGWATLWGPLGESPQTPTKASPSVFFTTGANEQSPSNLPRTKQPGKQPRPRQIVKIVRHPEGNGAAAAPVKSQEIASTESSNTPASVPMPAASAPTPKTAAGTSGAAKMRAAVGVRESAPVEPDNGPPSEKPNQYSSDTETNTADGITPVPIPPVTVDKAAASPVSVSADAVTEKDAATPVQKHSIRRHRRARRHNTMPIGPSSTPTQNTDTPVDDTPKPVHILAKPVE